MTPESLNCGACRDDNCYATASKQNVTAGFHGNRYAQKKRRTVGNGVFIGSVPRKYKENQLEKP
jgi:uncharacterized ferredoxin-like protein